METEIAKSIVKVRFTNPKKAGVFTFGSYYDSKIRRWKDLRWADGEPRVFKINGSSQSEISLDITDDDDKLLYEHIVNHPGFVKRVNPLIAVVNQQKESTKKLDHEELALKAKNIISDIHGEQMAAFARILGINPRNVSVKTLKLALFEYCNSDPENLINEWNDKDRGYKELLKKGEDKGIFKVTKTGVWKWKDYDMGINEDQTILFLKDKSNADILPMIRKAIDDSK
jgi:hypothetical protein